MTPVKIELPLVGNPNVAKVVIEVSDQGLILQNVEHCGTTLTKRWTSMEDLTDFINDYGEYNGDNVKLAGEYR